MHKTISSLWIGPSLSVVEQLCIRSFLENGHDFHLFTYEPVANVPAGANVRDGREILPESKIFRSKTMGIAAFADYFRWTLMRRSGGVWVDMDVVCLKPFDFEDDVFFGKQNPEGGIATGVLGFPPEHPLATAIERACDDVNLFQPIDTPKSVAKKLWRRARYGKEKSRARTRYAEPGGPEYFAKFVEFLGYGEAAKPQEWFYPLPYWEWRKIFEPSEAVSGALRNSYAVHLWNAILSHDETVDKNARLPNTLLGDLMQRYGVS